MEYRDVNEGVLQIQREGFSWIRGLPVLPPMIQSRGGQLVIRLTREPVKEMIFTYLSV
jgi:hypothetical protein